VVLVGLLLAWGAEARAAADEPALEAALRREAPRVLGYLKGHGYRTVGVLKFRVKKGTEPVSDRVGALNLDLAARLEVALVLANDVRAPLGVVRDASAVAATIPGANHLTAPGRQALFRGRYPLAWGNERVEPDAFLTGVAALSPDLKTVTVHLLAFGRDGGAVEKVGEFMARTDAPTLAAAGESFRTRGAFDAGEVATTEAVDAASKVKAARQANPLADPAAPVGLEVVYDGRPVPVEFRGGRAFVREPAEGQSVRFVVRKRDRTADRYGVVLLVNGLNTLRKERLTPAECSKWVLGPGAPAVEVRGFQTDAATAEAFRVLSSEESRRNEMSYGPEVGSVTLVVFRERKGPPPPALDDEGEDLAAIARATMPRTPPANLAALKYRLHAGADAGGSRGLIVEGRQTDSKIRTVEFIPDPTPVMSATITYYKP
jgi:hypothetical protein